MKNLKDIKVLIAEDDYLVSEEISRILKKIGCTVVCTASNGEQAIEKTYSLKPDVILMDIKMPIIDGLEATQKIQQTCPTPVVIMTAHESLELVNEASQMGASAYLVKPPQQDEIERSIIIAIARHDDLMELRRLKNEWETTFNAIENAVFLIDMDGKIQNCNKKTTLLFDLPFEQIIGKHCWQVVHKTTERIKNCPFQRLVKSLKRENMIFPVGNKWFEATVDPIFDSSNNLTGAVHIVSDITEKKQAEEKLKGLLKEKEVLIKEVHHRVKNNFNVIVSLLKLQSKNIKDTRVLELFRESQNRIKSMALIHQNLYQSKDITNINLKEYISSLTRTLYHSYNVDTNRVSLRIDIENISLEIEQIIACGLIVNELISNSFKHAFPESWKKKGDVLLHMKEKKGNEIELMVSNNGVPLPDNFDIQKTDSLGMKLVSMLAEGQLKGSLKILTKDATQFFICFKK